MNESSVLDAVTRRLMRMPAARPVRIGVDGMCGAGKSTFRRALADRLRTEGRPVVEVDSDGFHHVRAVRYRQGRESARGYYEDAYDLDALARLTLDPLDEHGDRVIATKIHDLETDETTLETVEVPADAFVLFDCTFIQRGDLRSRWDAVIYLDTAETAARRRGVERDRSNFESLAATEQAFDHRYLAACRIYQAEEHPLRRADIVVDNTDPLHPRLRRA